MGYYTDSPIYVECDTGYVGSGYTTCQSSGIFTDVSCVRNLKFLVWFSYFLLFLKFQPWYVKGCFHIQSIIIPIH